jgi:signal transduction histidine kinase
MEPIKQTFERQREFLADASHELRTPLSVLLSSVDAVQSDDANVMSPFAHQVLVDMKDEIKKMSKIVGDLLTLARAENSQFNLMKEQFDLGPDVRQIIRTLNPMAQAKQITLKTEIMDNLLIYADRERIAQLFLILLDNAIKYTPNGGIVELSVRLTEVDSKELRISVRDNGIGIASEEQARIFERFYRVDKTRSREMGGSGLGLAIAKWIAEIHGGSIKVNSQPGAGSEFVVSLPQ